MDRPLFRLYNGGVSLSFPLRRPPSDYPALLRAVGLEDVKCMEDPLLEGETLHFYRSGVSCRAVEISATEVRLLACSCPEDYDLAFRFLAAMGEERPAVDVDAQIRADLRALAEAIARDGTLTIQGPVRPFYIGPSLIREVAGRAERLFEAMRRVQYAQGVFAANILPVAAPEPFTVTAWPEGVRVLFPPVDYLVLESDIFLPSSALPDVAGDRFHLIDEKQSIVDAFEGEEWKRLLERVEKHRAYPVEPPRAARDRKWWQFWR